MASEDLRRSYVKMDLAAAMNRERSFVRQHQHQVRDSAQSRRRSSAMPANRDLRSDMIQNGMVSAINPRLNVHAKEFTMKQGDLATSRSSINIPATMMSNHSNHHRDHRPHHHLLQQSKSSGNVLHTLQQSSSIGNIQQGPRVHFLEPELEPETDHFDIANPRSIPSKDFSLKTPAKSHSTTEMKSLLHDSNGFKQVPELADANNTRHVRFPATLTPGGLKRSKSLGAADMASRSPHTAVPTDAPALGAFPVEVVEFMRRATEDPNKMQARELMELVRCIMERIVCSVQYGLPAAKLCITIIEKEKNERFLESLLNTCQQWYQERARMLRGSPGGSATPAPSSKSRYCAFMQFINEMYCELKRRQLQLKTEYQGASPGTVLLTLLCECCIDCLQPPNTQSETDSLFFVLTSIGRDLQQEQPAKLSALMASIRDAFLSATALPTIKKTQLQLIELHAAHWQLSAPAVMYYTTNH